MSIGLCSLDPQILCKMASSDRSNERERSRNAKKVFDQAALKLFKSYSMNEPRRIGNRPQLPRVTNGRRSSAITNIG
jgi:hypothetical protein